MIYEYCLKVWFYPQSITDQACTHFFVTNLVIWWKEQSHFRTSACGVITEAVNIWFHRDPVPHWTSGLFLIILTQPLLKVTVCNRGVKCWLWNVNHMKQSQNISHMTFCKMYVKCWLKGISMWLLHNRTTTKKGRPFKQPFVVWFRL